MLKKLSISEATITLCLSSLGAYADKMATGQEIQKAITGNTLYGSMTIAEYAVWSELYNADGTIKGKDYTGKWRIKDTGVCMTYASSGEGCWEAKIEGPAIIWYQDGKITGTSTTHKGNPNKF